MSARKQELTSQDISYTWTNSSKTEFVLHCDGTGIVRGFVGPGRKSFSIEVGLSLSWLESRDSRAAKLVSQIIAEQVSMNAIDGFVEQGSVDLQ